MQGKCNLFKPVNNTTGTFFSFSQYAQDLTKEYTQPDSYRCVPSRFAALNLNAEDIENYDIFLGEMFQNYFENACSNLRNELGSEWNGSKTLPIVWDTLEHFGLITTEDRDGAYHCDNLKYIGDINIYSYNPTPDGIGYNEIYCLIPNEAKSMDYGMQEYSAEGYVDIQSQSTIVGYNEDDDYTGLSMKLDGDPYKYYKLSEDGETRYYDVQGIVPSCLIGNSDQDSPMNGVDSFQFNAILVFYDIVSKQDGEDSVIMSNIPLGIYFTGKPENGEFTNTVTKFVNSSDAFNQGTSYGLRICSRFLCSPNAIEIENFDVTTSTDNENFSHLLSLMAENLELFAEISRQINEMNKGITTHMACFRNNKTNVPYLRMVNGDYYWFVNGKNTGVAANSVNQEDVNNIIARLDAISTNIDQTVSDAIAAKIGEIEVTPMSNDEIDESYSAHFLKKLNGE